jgi:UDP-N-acetyl-D-mannosaminuronic acid dehydrogenase
MTEPACITPDRRVAIVGLGYIGLPLALSFASTGARVIGVDTNPAVRKAIEAGDPLFYEPGVLESLRAVPANRFEIAEELPDEPLQVVVLCVGTAIDPDTKLPDLRHLKAATEHVAKHLAAGTLVVVRSTVPVGTCRSVILPRLAETVERPMLAMCPERTIQGMAMREIRSLPQVVGGIDDVSLRQAAKLLAPICPDQVAVSSIEAAEMVKLVCNAHTDLIYGFGNEIAMLAAGAGLDANEVIAAANLRYPRPDLSRPGFVGGSCLIKDPYLLLDLGRSHGYPAPMVTAARAVNESIPAHAVERLIAALKERGTAPEDARVLVCGVAYKGKPQTDDTRGSAAIDVAALLSGRVLGLAAHDFVVPAERIAALGIEPVDLDQGLRDADALLLLTDHPGYEALTADRVLTTAAKHPVIFDMWGVAEPELSGRDDLTYVRLGRG